jgi:hypothetical protein
MEDTTTKTIVIIQILAVTKLIVANLHYKCKLATVLFTVLLWHGFTGWKCSG